MVARNKLAVCCSLVAALLVQRAARGDDKPSPARRVPWTTPFVTGSPEPPPPLKTVRVFPNVQFKNPVVIEMPPGDPRWWVAEPAGKLSVVQPENGGRADLICDFNRDHPIQSPAGEALRCTYLYGIAFHPRYQENHEVFFAYTLVPPKAGVHLDDGTRVSRFKVIPGEIPRIDFRSEEILLTFPEGGHNGACLEFGPEGCLYISTGDAGDASPPDMRNTGQDNRDLLSCILRIDIDRRDPGLNYSVPADNPFVGVRDVRPEIWAYGFRNPWKMSFDRATGELWVGDIGWELWEMVHRVERGANYGWSVMEGPQPVRIDLEAGAQPITAPLLALPHTAAASITGGFVYRGRKFPELTGKYIFGDWETHRIWSLAAPPANQGPAGPLQLTDLAPPTIRIIDFGQDHDGELVIMDYDAGTLHAFERNDPAASSDRPFPKTLSHTGLFESVAGHQVAAGVLPLEISAELWADGAAAERYVAVPNSEVVKSHRLAKQTPGSMFRRHFEFPKDSVLMKTLSLPQDQSRPGRRIETQLLHFDGLQWQAYTYRWNEDETDAELVPAEGDAAVYTVKAPDAPGGARPLHWTFASRSQCLTCHTGWAESTLAFTSSQLLTPLGNSSTNRLDAMVARGLVERQESKQPPPKNLTRWDEESILVPPFDEKYPLDQRARSYLDANCAHCHRFGGGGTAQIDLRAGIPLEKTKTVNEVPTKGNLDLEEARIITPGNPWRSVLFLRMATCGRGRMPHLASEVIDSRGLALIEAWIRSLDPAKTSDETRYSELLAAASRAPEGARREQLGALLADRAGALFLARMFDQGRLDGPVERDVLATVQESRSPDIQALFARHLPAPPADRVGLTPRAGLIRNRAGDVPRGRVLFETSKALNCRTCHRVGAEGGAVGPELTRIGHARTRDELLDSLLFPSAIVDPRFATYVVELTDGRLVSGVISQRSSGSIQLRNATGELISISSGDIERIKPQRASLMPDGLLKDLSLQEAADLLAYLESLR